MTSYLCYDCGIKTRLKRHLDCANELPTTEKCPNCGEKEKFEYL